jgi:hypothetical protein
MKMPFQEIRIIATGPCIANQLRDVNTICRRSWYIAAQVWKIYDFKIEVVLFIINFSTELTTVVKFEVQVQKWCGRSCIGGLFNFQLWRIEDWYADDLLKQSSNFLPNSIANYIKLNIRFMLEKLYLLKIRTII